MTAKEYLQAYSQLHRDLDRLTAEKAHWERLAGQAGSAEAQAEIGSLEREIDWKIAAAVEGRGRIEALISRLHNPMLREIICRKYILGETLERVAEEMNISERHVRRLHKKAIVLFAAWISAGNP